MISTRRLVLVSPLLFAGLLVLGCGNNTSVPANVSGTVTVKKKDGTEARVTGGMVRFFLGEGGGVYSARINSDGTYAVKDLPTGTAKVAIETESINPKRSSPSYSKTGGKGAKGAKQSPVPEGFTPAAEGVYVPIDTKWGDPNTSGLTAKISSGSNTENFTVTGP
jgi:hypothetical protein